MLGYTPQQVNGMSIWQFMAALEGYRKAHDPEAAKKLSQPEQDALWEMVQAKSRH